VNVKTAYGWSEGIIWGEEGIDIERRGEKGGVKLTDTGRDGNRDLAACQEHLLSCVLELLPSMIVVVIFVYICG